MSKPYSKSTGFLEARSIWILFAVVISMVVNLNILTNGFVWDDEMLFLQNKWITDIKYIPEMFTLKEWAFTKDVVSHSNWYRPVFHLFGMAGYLLSGLNPWGYHLVGLLFHTANTVLVFLITSVLFNRLETRNAPRSTIHPFFAFTAAILFAIHPINTEVVAWTSAASDLTFTFFLLLSFYLYIRPRIRDENDLTSNLLSAASFLFALLCKETAMALPGLLILYDYSEGKGFSLSQAKRYTSYLIIIVIYFLLRDNALGNTVPTSVYHSYLDLYQYIINIFPLIVNYIYKLILPINLNAFHLFYPVYSLSEPRAIAALLFILLLAVLTVWLRRVNRIAFFCLIWMFIPLLPALYIPVVGRNVFAERYAYLSSIGFAILTAYLFKKVFYRLEARDKVIDEKSVSIGKAAIVVSIIVITGLYATGTIKRHLIWRSDYTLWTETVRESPDNYFAYNFLGDILSKKGMLSEAVDAYNNSLRFGSSARNPDPNILGSAHYNLGLIHSTRGLKQEALLEYDKAIEFKPRFFDAYYNSGIIYYEADLLDQAIARYKDASRFAANSGDWILSRINLGNAYTEKGLLEEAITEYEKVLKVDPDNEIAGYNLRALSRKR
ncbi:MAG: tetratricopeptide repeat protein [Thermodesulfobacteriota bacterium]